MIQLKREEGKPVTLNLSVLCIGNAGVNLADRLTVERAEVGDVVAINSDSQSLMACVAPHKIQIGRQATRGLGTGGDPDLGIEAVEESLDEILPYLEQRDIVVLASGLGGGTGSGATPVVAEAARNAGAFVIGLVTHPFQFEGRRRQAQARDAEQRLARYCDLLLIFENDRLSEIADPHAGIHDAFTAADDLVHQTIESIASISQTHGPMHIRFDDLVSFARTCDPRAGVGIASATGPNRANEVVEAALKCPLLANGSLLDACDKLLVHFAAPADFSLVELQSAMRTIERHTSDDTSDDAQLSFGIGLTDATNLRLTLIAGTASDPTALDHQPASQTRPHEPPPEPRLQTREPTPEPEPQPAAAQQPEPAAPPTEVEPELLPLHPEPAEPPEVQDSEPQEPHAPQPEPEQPQTANTTPRPRSPAPIRTAASQPQTAPPTKEQQQTLQFEPVARGRFEKSEPTIVEGEDLDVPTFLRLRLKK